VNLRQVRGSFRTVPELMKEVAQAHPDRACFVDGAERLTFGRWDEAADGVARSFQERGLGRGDVLCLVLRSSIDFAVCYQAAMRIGAVTSAINPRLGPAEVSSILERTHPRVTVHERGWAPPGPAGSVLEASGTRAAWSAGPPVASRISSSDPVAVVWTSGTTGRPKGAVFDHDNLAAVARGTGDLGVPGDTRLSPLPFAHVGFMTRPWEELSNAITTVITPTPWKPEDALRLIQQERVTVGQGVPAQWSLMLAHPSFDATDTSSLRVAGTGAASVAPEMVKEMRERLGCPVVVGYASTEAAIICRSRIGDSDEDVAQTVGTAAEGVEVEVVADDGSVLPPGQAGSVRCRSAAAMRRYWDDAASGVLGADGWLDTGDIGRMDSRGYLTILGRKGDMYIRGGYNVYPAEVEAVLAEHPAVAEAAVVGVPAEVLGQVGVAFVVSRDAGGDVEGELKGWVASRLADYKVPDRVVPVRQLPLTAMSKVDKRALAAMAEEGGKREGAG
jgi:acyl-CoA synthetase (AMP-forming)/AMP-acid ligase II